MDVHASIEVYQPANGHCLEIVWKPRRSYCANNPPPRPAPPNDNNASKIVRTHLHDAKSHHTFSAPQIGVLGLFCLCTRPLCLYTRSLLPLYCASGPLPPPLLIRVRARVGYTQSGWHGFSKSSLIQPISHLVLFRMCRENTFYILKRQRADAEMCSLYTSHVAPGVVSASAR
jgi:hypothetical protein